MSEESTYQPGWGDEKQKHHHHHHSSRSKERNRGYGGALRMIDKQAYVGLMLIIVVVLALGAYKVLRMAVTELREMPNDDPNMEIEVDELRIHKVQEQDALLLGDSLAQEYNVDSLKRKVQIETRPVYRPPRPNNEWYITEREWKNIWKNYRIWKRMQQQDEETHRE